MRILLIFLIMGMGLVFAYTAPSFDAVDLVLDTGYTAPSFDSVDLVLGEPTSNDTCTYTSGSWNIDCGDNCVINSNVNLNGNNMEFSNSGEFRISANIINYASINLNSGCIIVFDDNAQLIS